MDDTAADGTDDADEFERDNASGCGDDDAGTDNASEFRNSDNVSGDNSDSPRAQLAWLDDDRPVRAVQSAAIAGALTAGRSPDGFRVAGVLEPFHDTRLSLAGLVSLVVGVTAARTPELPVVSSDEPELPVVSSAERSSSGREPTPRPPSHPDPTLRPPNGPRGPVRDATRITDERLRGAAVAVARYDYALTRVADAAGYDTDRLARAVTALADDT